MIQFKAVFGFFAASARIVSISEATEVFFSFFALAHWTFGNLAVNSARSGLFGDFSTLCAVYNAIFGCI